MTAPKELAVAVDLGGTKVAAALVDSDGNVLPGTRYQLPTGRAQTKTALADSVRGVIQSTLKHVRPTNRIIGIGVGSAGPISITSGTVSPLNLPAWRSYPLAKLVRETTGLDPTIRLDGTCTVLAEHWVGALRNFRTALGMVVSTGIGGGLLIDGSIAQGRTGNAGHIGQIQLTSRTSTRIDHGSTLEGIAAGPNIVAWAQAHGWVGSSGEELAAAYRAGDPIALSAVHRCAHAVAEGIASIGALLDLEAVAIGGGFSRVAPDLIDIIRATLSDIAPLTTMSAIRIFPSALSDGGPLIGAAGLIHRADMIA